MGLSVAVAGASGYAGGELLRLIAGHPDLELAVAAAHGSAGRPITAVHPQLRPYADRTFAETDSRALAAADLVFLALPHGASGPVAAALPAATAVVDLGADHRLADPADWERAYGGPHPGCWPYGLPELSGQRPVIRAARRVAAPGCYPTAVALALAPLLRAGLAGPADVVVTAASGVSGAGRTPTANLLGAEVIGDLVGYQVGRHRHVPEMKQATGASSLSFTPVLAPLTRGILASVSARPVRPVSVGDVQQVLAEAYAGEPFVHLLAGDQWPRPAATLGSNAAQLRATVDADSGRIVVLAALDNLGKGAAGQAVQCANLMLGLAETAGLTAVGVAP